VAQVLQVALQSVCNPNACFPAGSLHAARWGGDSGEACQPKRKAPISAKKLKEKIQKWQSDDGDSMLGDG
jgi:hypothetical protein